MSNKITKIQKINVLKFRALQNIAIPFGERVTVICGKNGTAKSTILGLLAQIFSFSKDYASNTELEYSPLHSGSFKSNFSDHFRLSEKFDFAGELEASYTLYDAYFDKIINPTLRFYKLQDRRLPRAIVRNNIVTPNVKNDSRNVTHPVIYLSLNRLIPIAHRTRYETKDLDFLKEHSEEFIRINNQLLCKSTGTQFTSTTGFIESTAVHSDTYDHEAISAGEDNAGQIVQAIFSFKKLKQEYPDYHGGMLLIDEADAGLFPGAQYQLKEILNRYAKELNLQIIITTHSPILIEEYHQLSQRDHKSFKTIYLSNKSNRIEVLENMSWADVFADISVKMKDISNDLSFPETNVYFEDDEARAFFNALVTQRKLKKPLKLMSKISMGCGNYIELIRQKVPEFNKLSLIVFDGDVPEKDINTKEHKNVIKLPGSLPPDQLLFEFLFTLPEGDGYWNNKAKFTKDVFYNMLSVTAINNQLKIPFNVPADFSLKSFIDEKKYSSSEEDRVRQLFKNFFKSNEIQTLIKGGSSLNPFRILVLKNPEFKDSFCDRLETSTKFVLTKNKGVPTHLVESWYENT